MMLWIVCWLTSIADSLTGAGLHEYNRYAVEQYLAVVTAGEGWFNDFQTWLPAAMRELLWAVGRWVEGGL